MAVPNNANILQVAENYAESRSTTGEVKSF